MYAYTLGGCGDMPKQACRVYWGSHGCQLKRGHGEPFPAAEPFEGHIGCEPGTCWAESLGEAYRDAVARGDWFRQAWANAAHCSVEEAERAYETLGAITESAEDRIRRARGQQQDRRIG